MKLVELAGVLALGFGCVGTADAAIAIKISQVGSDVLLTASGTFDRSLSTLVMNVRSSPVVTNTDKYVGFGKAALANSYSFTGPSFYTGGSARYNPTSNTGSAIAIRFISNEFIIASDYINNTLLSSSGTITNATLSDIGFATGSFEYKVGGNTVTVDIGQAMAAVPEISTWAMMLVGFGLIGAATRYRRKGMGITYA